MRLFIITITLYTYVFLGSQPRKNGYCNEAIANDILIEMKECRAYEVVQLSKQKPSMEENPAYGEIGAFQTDL